MRQPVNDPSNIVVGEVHAIVILVEEAHFPVGKYSRGAPPGSKVRKAGRVSFLVAKMAAFHVKENDRLCLARQARYYLIEPNEKIGVEPVAALAWWHILGEGHMVCFECNLGYRIE